MTINSEKWIESLPDEWSITKIGNHFKCRNEKVNDTDYPPLSVAKQGVVPQIETVAKTDANDNRKLVLMNDFVINSRSDRKESCGLSKLNGSVSLINHVLYQNGQDYYMPFVGILFKNYGFAEEFYRWGHGIVADLWTTRWQEMKNIEIPLPPLKEQKSIFDFLTNRTSKIDQLISNQEKQIEKLEEYKKAVITKAVTKGLDPGAKMKDSGVEWIEKIPEGWSVLSLKSQFKFEKGLPITKADLTNAGIKVISYGQIHSKKNCSTEIDNSLFRFVSTDYLKSNPSCLVHKNDLIFADTSEDLEGTGDFVRISEQDTIFAGYHSIILRNVNNLNTKYLSYLFLSDIWRSQLRCRVFGVKLFSVTQKLLNCCTILLPNITEQENIVRLLDSQTKNIRQIIDNKKTKISMLVDYKKSLIYEYVTGKKEC